MTKHLIILLAAVAALCPATSNAAVVSTFDGDTDGWSAIGDIASPATFSSSGGNPGGHIFINDAVTGGVTYFVAPSKFLGDQSTSYGTPFTFDLMQSYSGAPNQFNDADIFLVGAGLTLVFDAPLAPTNNSWASYNVTLMESAGWRIDSLAGAAPSQAQMQNVLSDITSLRLRAEFQTGPDTGSLDNVSLVPEPTTASLLAVGLCLAALRRRRRQQSA